MICDSRAWSDDDSSITTKNPLACEPQTQRNKMILELSSLSSLLQNCLPPAANQKLGRCRRAVLVDREVFARPPRDESFTLNTRLGLVSITQQALSGDKSKIMTSDLVPVETGYPPASHSPQAPRAPRAPRATEEVA
jgi:hypothetical protein